MSDERRQGPRHPPRWFVRLAWSVHRALYRVTGDRVGLWPARANRWGALRLTTTGRRSGRERSVIIAYLEDGPDLIAMAMHGWADGEAGGYPVLLRGLSPLVATVSTGSRRPVVVAIRLRSGTRNSRVGRQARWQRRCPLPGRLARPVCCWSAATPSSTPAR